MEFINHQDPLSVALIAGIIGGLTQALLLRQGHLELPQISREGKLSFYIGFLMYCWSGLVAAAITWALSETTSNNVGVFAVALISGFSSVYFFEKLKETRSAVSGISHLTDTLANNNDALASILGDSQETN